MNESALILTHFQKFSSDSVQIVDIQGFDIKPLFYDIVKNETQKTFVIETNDPKAVFQKIKASVKFIKAAGGLVENGNQDYLFIKRLGKWDLPKGKVELGEKMKETAIREVEEECGIKIDSLGKKIESTYHVYSLRGEVILKKTNWYDMKVNHVPQLVPQLEEDISEAKWISVKDLAPIRENTYPLIKGLIKELA